MKLFYDGNRGGETGVRPARPDALTGDDMQDRKNILQYDTVALDDDASRLLIIDQTQLPFNIEVIGLKTQPEIWEAINLLKVRGAPAIGAAAAIGIYLAAKEIGGDDYAVFREKFAKAKAYLDSSRPTAVNLSWALKRMERCALANKARPVADIVRALKAEALEICDEDVRVCRAIGEHGLTLVKDGAGLLTHCNAGQLAAVKYGTATAPMYLGFERGMKFRIFSDETRPLLQGARLTTFELHSAGMDVTLICDNMAASVMKKGWVNAVFVGCDRVAANGDAANKIGTLSVAIAAKRYGIPVYFCAPTSTIDMETATGGDIVIEERPGEEITEMWYAKRMAPDGCKTYNPAFDVTDNDLITAFVTEYGVARAPFEASFREIFARKGRGEPFAKA